MSSLSKFDMLFVSYLMFCIFIVSKLYQFLYKPEDKLLPLFYLLTKLLQELPDTNFPELAVKFLSFFFFFFGGGGGALQD